MKWPQASAKEELLENSLNYNKHLLIPIMLLWVSQPFKKLTLWDGNRLIFTIPVCRYLTSWEWDSKKIILKGRWSDDFGGCGAADKK